MIIMGNYATSKTNQKLIAKSEALKKITEHNRDYLSLTLTIPLGNTALKKVHTNQWLFTNLPPEFDLANWTIIADALQSTTNRYEGYIKNRWYIEAIDTNVEANGKAEMKLTLNAFASSYSSYTSIAKDMQKAYRDAKSKNTKTSSKKGKTGKNKSNAVKKKKKSVINEKWVKKYNVPSQIVKIIKKICKTSNNDTENVKKWFHWMDAHVNYASYYGHQRSITTVLSKGSGNCVDNSRVFRAGCHALGVKCNYVQNTCTKYNHQYNKVYLKGKGIIVDCGRQLASWGSNWDGHSSCGKETSSSW